MKAILLATILSILSSATYAQETDATTRDHTSLEAEIGGNMDGTFFAVLKEIGLFGDGQADIAYQGRYFENGSEVHGVQLSLETRLMSICNNHRDYDYGGYEFRAMAADDECQTRNSNHNPIRMNLVNLETVVRVNIQDTRAIDLQKIRAGVLRLIFGKAGTTIQIASYLQQQFEISDDSAEDVNLRSIEVAHFNFTAVPNIAGSDSVQLVFRVNAGFGVGQMVEPADVRARIAEFRELNPSTRMDNQFGLTTTASSAIGFRFYDRVLVEGFYALDLYTGRQRMYSPGASLRERMIFLNQIIGTNVRITLTDHLQLWGRYERAHQRRDFLDLPSRNATTHTVTSGLEVRW